MIHQGNLEIRMRRKIHECEWDTPLSTLKMRWYWHIRGKCDNRIGLIPCCKKDISVSNFISCVSRYYRTIEFFSETTASWKIKTGIWTLDWTGSQLAILESTHYFHCFLTSFSGDVKKVFKGRKTNKIKTSSPFQSSRGSRVQSYFSFLLENT